MLWIFGIGGILLYLSIGGIFLGAISYDEEDSVDDEYELDGADATVILLWPAALVFLGLARLATWSRKLTGRLLTAYKERATRSTKRGDDIPGCVCCGELVPEGRQVCPSCEKGGKPNGRA